MRIKMGRKREKNKKNASGIITGTSKLESAAAADSEHPF